ncbi:hypothetical protein OS493_028523 [Desmophyllum pertusum]|uniref:Uncharacterized protein n=1 Tax=Desmophyllum pertusum TaxID=174260 RepID=A0A9W9Z9W2_9CNID|nr:hypothetical protein OS493_028523 [Desmophyllum pertusum]
MNKEYEDFLTNQRNMHYEGVKESQEIVKKYFLKEFEDILSKNESWTCPYNFKKTRKDKVKNDQALPTCYDMVDFSLADHISHSKTTHDAENDMETEDISIETRKLNFFRV